MFTGFLNVNDFTLLIRKFQEKKIFIKATLKLENGRLSSLMDRELGCSSFNGNLPAVFFLLPLLVYAFLLPDLLFTLSLHNIL